MQNNLPLNAYNQGANESYSLTRLSKDICSTNVVFLSTLLSFKSLFMKNLSRRFKLPVIVLIALLIVGINSLTAQTTSWKGISSDWDLGTNWSGGSKPTSTSVVTISAIGTLVGGANVAYDPILTATSYCKTLTMSGGTTISGSNILTIASGTLNISGTSTISCPLSISGVTTFNVTTSLDVTSLSGTGEIKTSTGILTLGNPITTFSKLTITSGTVNMGTGASSFSGIVTLSANNSILNLKGNTTVNGAIQLTRGTISIGSNTLVANAGISGTFGALSGSQSSNLILNGGFNENLNFNPGGEILNNLTLNHSSSKITTLGTDLVIYGSINFSSSKDNLDLQGMHVTLKSRAAGTAYIGDTKGGTIAGAGNVTVERYIDCGIEFTGKRAWRLLTIPVTGQTIRDAWCGAAPNADASTGIDVPDYNTGTIITGHGYATGTAATAAGFDWFTGLSSLTTSSIRRYTSASVWGSATNTPDITASPDEQGYLLYVRGDRDAASNSAKGYTVLKPTGALQQGPIAISVTEPYTVVGNPYASPINLDALYNNSGNSTVIKPNFWLWDATIGGAGAYRTLSGDGMGNYTMTSIAGGVAADFLVVNSSQAFFVEKEGAGGDITIEESNKVATTAPPVMFRPTGTAGTGVSRLDIKLFQATGSTVGLQADGVVGRYNNIYSVSPNESYDAAKMNNFNENLSLVRNGRYMSIESRPYPTQKDTLFISFWNLKNRDYAFTISSTMFAGINQTALLIDNFTNTQTILDMNDGVVTYPFSVTSNVASSNLNRFLIVMAPVTVLPVTFTKINASLIGSKVQVSWATGSEFGVKNYSIERSADGTHFTTIGEVAAINAANGTSYQFADNQPLPANNYYRIRSNDADGKYAFSSIAAVQLNAKKGIQVMPTVITNQRFTLALNDQPAGNYQLIITNTAGQQVYQKMIKNMGGNNTQVIELGNTAMPTGVYNLSVSGLNGNNQNFKLLIQK